jgi:hypothetical protein
MHARKIHAYEVHTYKVYTHDFDLSLCLAVPVGIPLCRVACGGVLWCPRMVPEAEQSWADPE